MVSVSNIEPPIPRFISRQELEDIKLRAERLPKGEYNICIENGKEKVFCRVYEDERKTIWKDINICQPSFPGLGQLFVKLQSDMEKLIIHIEQADHENDILLEKLGAVRQHVTSKTD